jgi:hypothetical protein
MRLNVSSFAILLVAGGIAANAQESFYRVYQYETPLVGWSEPAIWNTYIGKSDNAYGHGTAATRQGMWAHAAELEFGLTDHFSLAGYADFQDAPGLPPEYVQTRIEGRYRFAQAYEHFFDTAVYAEYYLPRKSFSNSQELETRLILQRDIEDWRIALNPIVSVATTGDEAGEAPNLQLAAGLYYRRHFHVQPGLEIYTDFGGIGHWNEQRYVAMPVVDLHLKPGLVWEIGVGGGLTNASDRLVVKSILYYEFNAVRPSRWFR